MKFLAVPTIATFLAACASLGSALPVEAEANKISTPRSSTSNNCSMDKIRECVDDTGLESTICFKQVCAGVQGTPRKTKRQEDQCTEENLLQCAVMEWREAEVCFQEFCL
ncbi:uncharacterized protein F4812DRAFT_445038 [Daldinia caldariorum]|uniref:uncharacterized protein n=1 Tax=Daldinia caldariorum TaxID=326644 RepID=UPI0020085CB1|nr:uncharacterized protein F4812DRAFT_445038 [Daldinia caldariorum]KAI1463942.1 hypothetical protein F4812DRAFT_445038 [Daldinia caldariorum]